MKIQLRNLVMMYLMIFVEDTSFAFNSFEKTSCPGQRTEEWGGGGVLSDSCRIKLDQFVEKYNQYVRPSAQKMVDFRNSKEKGKADSIKIEITRFYDQLKTEMEVACDVTRLDYVKKFYIPYLAFLFTGWPERRQFLFEEMEELAEACSQKNQDSSYLEVLNRKSVYHLRVNEYSKMKNELEKGIQFAEKNPDLFFNYLFVLRLNQALYFIFMNLPEEAIKASIKNDEMALKYGIHDKALYIRNLNYMADAYSVLNDENELIKSLNRIQKYCTDENMPLRGECDLSEHYFTLAMKQKNYLKADSLLNSGFINQIRDDSYDTKLRMIRLYTELGRYEEAKKIGEELSRTFEVYNLEGIHLYRMNLLNALLQLELKQDNLMAIEKILDEFQFTFLANVYNVFNEDPHLQYSILKPMQKVAWDVLQNLAGIQNKSIASGLYTLNTNIKKLSPVFLENRNKIMSGYKGNEEVTVMAEKLKELSAGFSRIQKSEIKDAKIRQDLMDSIIILEKKIQSALVADLQFTIPNITTGTIQQVMNPDQIFIEFFEVRDRKKNEVQLFAAVIKKEDFYWIQYPEFPEMANSKVNYTNNKEKNKIWYDYIIKPFEADLVNKKDIFIVSDGLVHQVPLEVLSPDGTRKNSLIEKYNIRYFSSSKSFLDKQEPSDESRTVRADFLAMGGIQYNCNTAIENEKLVAFRSASDSLSYLPGTLAEVNLIRQKKGNSVKVLTGCTATKAALLKDIEQKSSNILHISTHGVLYRPTESTSVKQHFYLQSGNEAFLALANQPEGFLSAYEITNQDARHVDLVYLSACSSGVGPSISGQGLFSIGDAFAAAGAGHVIYTLWDIPDDFAVEFAGRFYENWKPGTSISFAFDQTRKALSKQYTPALWAAFRLAE